LELMGRFDQSTQFENFNGAAAYATEALRIELFKYVDQLEANQTYPIPPTDVTTIATVTNIEIVNKDGSDRILASIEGITTTKKDGIATEQEFTGSLSMISRANIWFVDDMDIEPDFLGFK